MKKSLLTFTSLLLALTLCTLLPLGCGSDSSGGTTDSATDSGDTAGTTDGDATTTTGGDDTYPAECNVEPTLSSIQANYFNVSCSFSSCHGKGGSAGGLALNDDESYDALINVPAVYEEAAAKGKLLVVPGDAANSFLYTKLAGPEPDEGLLMPQGQQEPLGPDCQLRAVRDWINAGALDN